MRLDDQTYHQERAEAELQLAEASHDPAIAIVHRELAALHRRKLLLLVDPKMVALPKGRPINGGH